MSSLELFFEAIDRAWVRAGHAPTTLSIIGSTALMFQTNYRRTTKDSDVIETSDLPETAQEALLEIAGPKTQLFQQHQLYIDIVKPGLPLLPQAPLWHPFVKRGAPLQALTIRVLDVVDVTVSKLCRFNANDRRDITAMVELGLVSHDRFLERFSSALDVRFSDERSPSYARNFNAIERDAFLRDETQFEFPDWM